MKQIIILIKKDNIYDEQIANIRKEYESKFNSIKNNIELNYKNKIKNDIEQNYKLHNSKINEQIEEEQLNMIKNKINIGKDMQKKKKVKK